MIFEVEWETLRWSADRGHLRGINYIDKLTILLWEYSGILDIPLQIATYKSQMQYNQDFNI